MLAPLGPWLPPMVAAAGGNPLQGPPSGTTTAGPMGCAGGAIDSPLGRKGNRVDRRAAPSRRHHCGFLAGAFLAGVFFTVVFCARGGAGSGSGTANTTA